MKVERIKKSKMKYVDSLSEELKKSMDAIGDSLVVGVFKEDQVADIILGYTLMSKIWMDSRSIEALEKTFNRNRHHKFVNIGMNKWLSRYGFYKFYRQDEIDEKYRIKGVE